MRSLYFILLENIKSQKDVGEKFVDNKSLGDHQYKIWKPFYVP